jgi:membrane-associated protease RseP (regulator of RpoE activity)
VSMERRPSFGWPPPDRSGAQTASLPGRGARLPVLHALLLAVTALTTTTAGAFWEGVDPIDDARFLLRGLPFAASLIAILLVHEAGHYVMCLRHGVSASLPYFIPAPPHVFPLGTFGAFIRIRSRFPDRRALFDIGAAGPWAGFVVALFTTAVGLSLSTVLPERPTGHALELGDSLLTALLTRVVLQADPETVVLHPMAFAGWFGLFVTSINLLPVGQLDGGHVLYAAAGRGTRLLPVLLIAFLLWLGVSRWVGWLVWALILTALLTLGHPATDDDHRPLGPGRLLAALATLALFLVTFVAEPFKILP